MFTKEGEAAVTIGRIVPSEARFSQAPDAFDMNIHVTGENGETDWVRLEFSPDYGKGNFSDRTQTEISRDTLRKLGYEDDDLIPLFEDSNPLAGKAARIMVVESKPNEEGKTFFNPRYFITGGREPEAISTDAVKSRLAALCGGAGTAAAPAAAKPTDAAGNPATTKKNPFAQG